MKEQEEQTTATKPSVDVSLTDYGTGASIAAISAQIRAELEYHYADEHIIKLLDILTGLFINAYLYENEQNFLPEGDTLKKYIRRSISDWISRR